MKVLGAIDDERFEAIGVTCFAQAMPDYFTKFDDPVEASAINQDIETFAPNLIISNHFRAGS